MSNVRCPTHANEPERIHRAPRPVPGFHLPLREGQPPSARGGGHPKVLQRLSTHGSSNGSHAGGRRPSCTHGWSGEISARPCTSSPIAFARMNRWRARHLCSMQGHSPRRTSRAAPAGPAPKRSAKAARQCRRRRIRPRRERRSTPANLKARRSRCRHLTIPSSGRSKGRFAPFGPPLMSNVRPHASGISSHQHFSTHQ